MPPPIGRQPAPLPVRPRQPEVSGEVRREAKPTRVADAGDTFQGGSGGPVELTSGKTVSKAELEALRKAGKVDLAETLEGVQKNYKKLLDAGAKIVVTTSAGNNGRPIVTVVPPALANNKDPKVKYDVVVHYHGMHGSVPNPNGSSPTRTQIEASFKRSPPTVYVLPTAKIVPAWKGTTTAPEWSASVRDTRKTADDGVAGVVGTRRQTTVSAHSLGREALTAAIAHKGLKADRVDVQDGFSGAGDIKALHTWSQANPNVKLRISTGMWSQEKIQGVRKFDPKVFQGDYSGGRHWKAELQPW
ncbi:MAG: hypothetical protein JNK82_38395 [Myxococcaceae bacterium]|nr:hypothetical protein [Myxococcaceae bacterium]